VYGPERLCAVLRCAVLCRARFLAVGSYDNTVRVLSLEDGNQMRAVATQMVNVSVGSMRTRCTAKHAVLSHGPYCHMDFTANQAVH
jgi:hypothetical protein